MKTAKYIVYNITTNEYLNMIFPNTRLANAYAGAILHKDDKYELRRFIHDAEIISKIKEMIKQQEEIILKTTVLYTKPQHKIETLTEVLNILGKK